MRLILGLAALCLAVVFFVQGARPLALGGDAVPETTVDAFSAEPLLPPVGELVRVTGGHLVLGAARAAHIIGDEAFVLLLAPRDAARAPLSIAPAPTVIVARMSRWKLSTVARENAARSDSHDLGPFTLRGRVEALVTWPEPARALVERGLGFTPGQVLAVLEGERPRDRAFGIAAALLGLVAGLIGLALLRSRARAKRARAGGAPHASGSGGRLLRPLIALGAGIGVIAARFGDDVARHVDELDALRGVRHLEAPPAAVRGVDGLGGAADALSAGEGLEHVLGGVDALLTAKDVYEAGVLLSDVFGADVVVQSTVALTETTERYERVANDAFKLVAQRSVRRTRMARNGALGEVQEVVDDAPPSAAKGESVTLKLTAGDEPPSPTNGMRPLLDLEFEHTTTLLDAVPTTFVLHGEAWMELPDLLAGPEVRSIVLHDTPRGRERMARELERAYTAALESAGACEALGLSRLEATVRVTALAEATLSLADGALELRASGPTVIETTLAGWR
ncbi:MAG: hypothetical protein R3F49_16285 [Planctomycetota bacterium]